MKYIDSKANKGGSVHIEAHGVENIPKENGFMLFPESSGALRCAGNHRCLSGPIFSVVAKKEIGNIPIFEAGLCLYESISH